MSSMMLMTFGLPLDLPREKTFLTLSLICSPPALTIALPGSSPWATFSAPLPNRPPMPSLLPSEKSVSFCVIPPAFSPTEVIAFCAWAPTKFCAAPSSFSVAGFLLAAFWTPLHMSDSDVDLDCLPCDVSVAMIGFASCAGGSGQRCAAAERLGRRAGRPSSSPRDVLPAGRSARRERVDRSLDSAADRLEPLPERARTGFFSEPEELDRLARFFGGGLGPFLAASAGGARGGG